jgi:CBS domain-containing protein
MGKTIFKFGNCASQYICVGARNSKIMRQEKFIDAQIAELVEPAATFNSTETIARVIGGLKKSNEYDALVEDGDKVSVVSVRDLLSVGDITTEKLTRIMKQVPKLSGEDRISNAAKLMFDYRIRSLPVYEGRRLLGKVTCSTIAKALVDSNRVDESIARIATPDPTCVDASDSAAKAKRLMVDRKIDQLPILKQRRLMGVITSDSIVFNTLPPTDRVERGSARIGRLEMDAVALSLAQTVTNDVTDSLGDTLGNMLKARSNYSVIMSGDEVQGIVTYHDFLKLLPTSKVSEIPISIVGLPDDPLQSEMAKRKFQTSISLLSKAVPSMTEARAVIKSGESKAPKKRYQVQVFIGSADSHHSFEVSNYDLAKAFEEVEAWVKKLARRRGEKRELGKHRETSRKSSLH